MTSIKSFRRQVLLRFTAHLGIYLVEFASPLPQTGQLLAAHVQKKNLAFGLFQVKHAQGPWVSE